MEMGSCCHTEEVDQSTDSCQSDSKRDYFFWIGLGFVGFFYCLELFRNQIPLMEQSKHLSQYATAVYDLMNKMWVGIGVGALAVGLLNFVPSSFVQKVMKSESRVGGLARACFAGVLLDLCSHGILMVGMKLYKKGLSIGQTMAFLISSPWNSLSLTIILASMIGVFWTIAFLLLSMVIAFVTGYIFDWLADKGKLPKDSEIDHTEEKLNLKEVLARIPFTPTAFLQKVIFQGLSDSKSIIKWLFIGVIIASSMRVFLSLDQYQSFFGPDVLGLFVTLGFASILEVCSEGSAPIAGDIFTHAGAVGNSFAFLMTGVSTDYTEIMVIKETTRSWKVALLLPLISVPQIILISLAINGFMN